MRNGTMELAHNLIVDRLMRNGPTLIPFFDVIYVLLKHTLKHAIYRFEAGIFKFGCRYY